jgi:hypothetical protein
VILSYLLTIKIATRWKTLLTEKYCIIAVLSQLYAILQAK